MAEPKTGNSHTRGSQFIGSGLYVSGVARVAGAVRVGGSLNVTGALNAASVVLSTHMTGINLATGSIKARHLATGANSFLYSHNLQAAPFSYSTSASYTPNWKISALSGQTTPGMKFMPPSVAITVRALGFSLQTAGASASGMRFSIRSIPSSGSQVHKGYITIGASKTAVYKSGLTATIPAQNAVGICCNLANKTTSSGTQVGVTVYYTHAAQP